MITAQPVVDHFNTTGEGVYDPQIKIQSNNVWFNPNVVVYPEELKMLIQFLNNLVLAHALTSSFSIPMSWLSLVCSTDVYNKDMEVVTF